jgi:hypothetical protein
LNIGLFLVNAVSLALKYRNIKQIALFSEISCDVEMPVIGRVVGSLDYLTSTYKGIEQVGKGPSSALRLVTPHFLVVEAKTTETIGFRSSIRQLLAQMIALDSKDSTSEGRWGCLTNGQRWSFYYLEKVYGINEEGEKVVEGVNRYDLVNLETKDTEGISRIMGSICERFN